MAPNLQENSILFEYLFKPGVFINAQLPNQTLMYYNEGFLVHPMGLFDGIG
jgi:hypothetical protein